MRTLFFVSAYCFTAASLCPAAPVSAQTPPLTYTQSTQKDLYSVVFPAYPTTRGPFRQRNALGRWVEAIVQEVELPTSAKANQAYVVTFGPDNATPASLRSNLSVIATRVDRKFDAVYGLNGSIVFARVVFPAELAPLKLTCQEIVWRSKQGDFACLRIFYHRSMAVTLSVSGAGTTYNKTEVARFLYSFKPL